MKTVVVLAMHGVPPKDFPHDDLKEFFALHARHEAPGAVPSARYAELEDKLRRWPRTPENDSYHAASHDLAQAMGQESGYEVKVGFNEFCAPDMDEALAQAVEAGAERIIIATTMMTRGGGHAERDIAEAISRGRQKYPGAEIIYAWPFDIDEIARFLAKHIRKFTL